MTINAYPLSWPAGWKRTDDSRRKHGHFGKRVTKPGRHFPTTVDLTVHQAIGRVIEELQRMAVGRDDLVISTNIPVRLDGLPRSDAKRPADPGAAVYWTDAFNSAPRCIAIDQYFKVEDNLAAIAATLDAMRAIERHGGAAILERAFTGFTALPAPGSETKRTWWQVLGVTLDASADQVRAAYLRLASERHPDKGGSAAAMAELNAARDAALEACK